MALPVLLDLNVVADGAAALCLALAAEELEVRAVVAGGGIITAEQSAENAGRILGLLQPKAMPALARGSDPAGRSAGCCRAVDLGTNGLCNVDLPNDARVDVRSYQDVYSEFLAGDGPRCVVTAGPLTTLTSVLAEMPEALSAGTDICICGGAVWTRGNAGERVEFNFGSDPEAAGRVLTSGMPISVAPLDVTNYVCFDASNLAHLAASGYRTGELAARMLEPLLEQDAEPAAGKTYAAPVVAVAGVIWPDLFLKTRMRLDVATEGAKAGQSTPGLGGDKTKQIGLLTAVNAVELLEKLLESLCHEEFVV